MFEDLKKRVCEQNLRLPKSGLVILTEGNVSEISDDRKHIAIKPSGVSYDELTHDAIVVLDLEGNVLEGRLRPSSDTPTHLEIYRKFPEVKGIVHTHSPYATMFAQMRRPVPCHGTTHADAFYGDVPVTRDLTDEEIGGDFELNTGKVISEILDPHKCPAVLVASHGPFVFGASAEEAVNRACVLEKVAMMAILAKPYAPISKALLDKHFNRKHGKNRYYGQ